MQENLKTSIEMLDSPNTFLPRLVAVKLLVQLPLGTGPLNDFILGAVGGHKEGMQCNLNFTKVYDSNSPRVHRRRAEAPRCSHVLCDASGERAASGTGSIPHPH